MTETLRHPSIIFTMGPSTCEDNVLTAILSKNVSYVRFNMSHATHEAHRDRLLKVRHIAKTLNKDIKVFIDLCGPKIRVRGVGDESMNILPETKVIKQTHIHRIPKQVPDRVDSMK